MHLLVNQTGEKTEERASPQEGDSEKEPLYYCFSKYSYFFRAVSVPIRGQKGGSTLQVSSATFYLSPKRLISVAPEME